MIDTPSFQADHGDLGGSGGFFDASPCSSDGSGRRTCGEEITINGERLPTAAGGHHTVSEIPNVTREHGGDRPGGSTSGRPQTAISRHIDNRIGPRSPDFVQIQIGGAVGIGGVFTFIIDRYGHIYIGGGIIAGFGIDSGVGLGWTQDPMTPDELSVDLSLQGGGFNFDVGYGLGLSIGISDDWYNASAVGVTGPNVAISYTYMFDERQIRDFFK